MDSTGRRYLSMNDRLFCVCVCFRIFSRLEKSSKRCHTPNWRSFNPEPSHLWPHRDPGLTISRFPSRRCVQVVLGNARLSLPSVFPPDLSWMKSHLIQMNSFRRREVAAFMCLMDFLRIMWEDERGAEPFAVNRWRLRFKKKTKLWFLPQPRHS